jgi:hypothetical protein
VVQKQHLSRCLEHPQRATDILGSLVDFSACITLLRTACCSTLYGDGKSRARRRVARAGKLKRNTCSNDRSIRVGSKYRSFLMQFEEASLQKTRQDIFSSLVKVDLVDRTSGDPHPVIEHTTRMNSAFSLGDTNDRHASGRITMALTRNRICSPRMMKSSFRERHSLEGPSCGGGRARSAWEVRRD